MPQDMSAPVICIDGGAVTGKSTVRALVAQELGFHELNSGLLYRALGYTLTRDKVINKSPELWVEVARTMEISLFGDIVYVDGQDITAACGSSEISMAASQVSQDPAVRDFLRERQLSARQQPGLVADGRDMGEIFSGGLVVRFFLTASLREKTVRKVRQALSAGRTADFDLLYEKIVGRDRADMERPVSPLRPHPRAHVICTDNLSVVEVRDRILGLFTSALHKSSQW